MHANCVEGYIYIECCNYNGQNNHEAKPNDFSTATRAKSEFIPNFIAFPCTSIRTASLYINIDNISRHKPNMHQYTVLSIDTKS